MKLADTNIFIQKLIYRKVLNMRIGIGNLFLVPLQMRRNRGTTEEVKVPLELYELLKSYCIVPIDRIKSAYKMLSYSLSNHEFNKLIPFESFITIL